MSVMNLAARMAVAFVMNRPVETDDVDSAESTSSTRRTTPSAYSAKNLEAFAGTQRDEAVLPSLRRDLKGDAVLARSMAS